MARPIPRLAPVTKTRFDLSLELINHSRKGERSILWPTPTCASSSTALEKQGELQADLRRGGPGARDHRVRRPRRQAGRPGAAFREAQGLATSRCSSTPSPACGGWSWRWRSPRSRRSPRASPISSKCEAPQGLLGKLKMLPKLAELGSFFPKDVSGGPCKEVVRRDGFSLFELPDPAVLAPGRRALHHPAAGLLEEPRHRQAQLRHVPHAGLRRAHHRHALADAQAGRRALPPPADRRARQAHGRGGGHRRRPGHHVLRRPAPAAGPRRNAVRGLPARASRSRW